jgi:geranylgeranyl diphosphate synthase type I
MLGKIKNKIEKSLRSYLRDLNKTYSLNKISPLLAEKIKDFVLRPGKRVRPILFVLGYLAFAKKEARGLYQAAISIELLHDFMLIHDDIIDKSDTRRGKPSMHKMLNNYLKDKKNIKFSGEDLSLVLGDIVYASAIKTFLLINEEPQRKEKALKKFIDAAFYTGCGEFIELISGIKNIENITKDDIYKIYDFKTAYYTFAYPLSIGATLAGAKESDINKIFQYGLYLGRAFQIKDDILGIFGNEAKIGKSTLTDLQEAKKTLLIWHAYCHSHPKNQSEIKKILTKRKVNNADLLEVRRILAASGSLDYAQQEISRCIRKAKQLNYSCAMKSKYRNYLACYCRKILKLT